MPEQIRFTDSAVKALPIPAPKTKAIYVDYDPPSVKVRRAVQGLELVVSYTGVKSFVFRKKLNGRVVAVTLGRETAINVDTARKLAQQASSDIASGINPNKKKKAEKANGITLETCFTDYLTDRNLADNTVLNYQSILDNHLKSWKDKPLKLITRDMVENKHKILSRASQSTSNKTMRVLRSLFNYANGKYEDGEGRGMFPDNPVTRITAIKQWHNEAPRKNRINDEDFKAWFDAALNLQNIGLAATISDLLIFTLLTGLRRREASNLRWDTVDLKKRCFTVTETKNKETLLLPLSDYLVDMLERREKGSSSGFVFPGNVSDKPIQEPKKHVERLRKASGVEFTVHDLRRTFITVAESCEIAPYAIKALVNHKLPKRASSDITENYIVWTLERLREPMQRITDHILKYAGVRQSIVVELRKQN